MGKVIPFPNKMTDPLLEKGTEMTDQLIREKILAGEAELIKVFDQNGVPCACYRMEFDHQSYYIFDLTLGRKKEEE